VCIISNIVILTTNLVFCQSVWHLNPFSVQSKILIAVHNDGVSIFMQLDCVLRDAVMLMAHLEKLSTQKSSSKFTLKIHDSDDIRQLCTNVLKPLDIT